MKKIILAILVIAAIFAATAWKLLANKEVAEAQVHKKDKTTKVLVKTTKISKQDLDNSQQFLGVFAANKEVQVLSEANGKVVYVGVKEGEMIGEGSQIAKIDDELLRYQLLAAEASYTDAMNDRKNYETLAKGDAVTQMQLNKAILAEKTAESQVKILQKQLKSTSIISPFSGIVTAKLFELGSVINAGNPLIQLTDIATLKLLIKIPEKEIVNFKVGQVLTVKTDVFQGVEFKGTVSLISVKDDANHNYTVQILVQNSLNNASNMLRVGMYGYVKQERSLQTNALTIPKTALVGTIKQPQVYVFENGKAVLKDIVLGVSTNDSYEIISGLVENEEVITTGQINLQNGTVVTK